DLLRERKRRAARLAALSRVAHAHGKREAPKIGGYVSASNLQSSTVLSCRRMASAREASKAARRPSSALRSSASSDKGRSAEPSGSSTHSVNVSPEESFTVTRAGPRVG